MILATASDTVRWVAPTDDYMATWEAFLRAHHRVVRRLDDELKAAHGLPLEWYDVLVQLSNAGGRLKMSELADAVLITAPNCTRLVDRMEAAGLVAREISADDKRARFASLTATGHQALSDAAPTHLAGIEHHFGRWLPAALARPATAFLAAVAEAPGDARE